MQTSPEQTPTIVDRIIGFLIYLVGGLLIFLYGANTFNLYPTNDNLGYEIALTCGLLTLTVIMQRIPRLQLYSKISGALFIASIANTINLVMGNFVGKSLQISGNSPQAFAIDKISQSVPIVLSILLLSLWIGDSFGSLFLKKGNLRLGLRFGLISYAIFAIIFAVILIVQANAPRAIGLFATGFSLKSVLVGLPWWLVFCFVNAFMEELWFRGVSLGKLAPVAGSAGSIIVTALVFGISHTAATYVTPVQSLLFGAIVVILGLVNAYMMLKTDSIWGSVLFHAGYDLLTILPIMATM